MTILIYPYLGDAVKVGDPLGCDPTGWPYQVVIVRHARDVTEVAVEPWPLPSPAATEDERVAYEAAMAHARERKAGRIS